jgi:hypothetical protein
MEARSGSTRYIRHSPLKGLLPDKFGRVAHGTSVAGVGPLFGPRTHTVGIDDLRRV